MVYIQWAHTDNTHTHINNTPTLPDVPCRSVGWYALMVSHYTYVHSIYIYKQYIQSHICTQTNFPDVPCRFVGRYGLLVPHYTMCITYIYIYKQYIQYTRMYTIRFPRESERARERESERESVCVRTIKFPDLVDSSGGIDCWCLITFICIIYMYM